MELKLLTVLLFVCCFEEAWPQAGFQFDNNRKRQTIKFQLVRNLVIVKLSINDHGPYNFVLDTGVGLLLITGSNLSDSLDISNKRTIKIMGLGMGEPIEAEVTPSVSLDLSGISAKGVSAAILKKDVFGLSNYAGIPIHGILGYEFFNSFPVKINFIDSTLTVYNPLKRRMVFRKGFKVPITIENRKPYLQAKTTFKNGKSINAKLIVDIGAGHALSLENRDSIKEGLGQKFISANLGVGLTGPISGSISRIASVEIGKYRLPNVVTSFPDYNEFQSTFNTVKRDGNLGLGILKRFTILFDYAGQSMYIRPTYRFKEPFEHDMSGMEYYADGEDLNHIIINRVEPGSAADDAGVKKDDEIISINFKPVHKMTVQEIDDLFRSKGDRTLLLEFYRENKYIKVILTLKKRI